jgi:prophage regulatory protein
MTAYKRQFSAQPMSRAAAGVDSVRTAGTVSDNTVGRSIRLLRLAQVMHMTGLGRTKVYELQAAGQFPMRVQITSHSVGWVEEEVQAWIAQRVAARPALPVRPAALRALR